MFRLILIYTYREHDYAPREYGERVFESMTELMFYLQSVNTSNIYRVIIERI